MEAKDQMFIFALFFMFLSISLVFIKFILKVSWITGFYILLTYIAGLIIMEVYIMPVSDSVAIPGFFIALSLSILVCLRKVYRFIRGTI